MRLELGIHQQVNVVTEACRQSSVSAQKALHNHLQTGAHV